MRKKIFTITLAFSLGVLLFAPTNVFAYCVSDINPTQTVSARSDGSCPAGSHDNDTDEGASTLGGLVALISGALNTIVPFLISIAVLVIIWEVFKYIHHVGDEEKRTEARMYIVWSVIGVFAMISVWGFINILVNTLPLKKTPIHVQSVFPS